MLNSDFTKKDFLRMLEKNNKSFLVAENNGKIIASVFGNDDGGYYGYIYKLIVKKEFRNRGIAINLLNKLSEVFRERRIKYIFAHIQKENHASTKLFEKLGFKNKNSFYIYSINC